MVFSSEKNKIFVQRVIRAIPCYFLLSIFILLCFNSKGQASLLDSIINPAEARKIVEFLASDSLKGRLTGTDEAQKAAEFIADEFKNSGIKPIAGFNGYFMQFPLHKKQFGYNVLCGLEGKTKPNEVIIFSAHYDHIGAFSTRRKKRSKSGNVTDAIYNGANDDASGVAAVILLARYFAALNNNERTLVFIAFSGEELGLLGSKALSKEIKPQQTKAVINIEMIGRNRSDQVHPFITGHDLSDLISILNDGLKNHDINEYGKRFFINDPYLDEELFRRSDNLWFSALGIPSHTIMLSSPTDEFYHSVEDEVETLDFDIMAQVIRAIALGSESIVQGVKTP